MIDYVFRLDFEVRDYECDLQGVVNNSVYLNYLEHTRHEFIKTFGIDFADFHRRGIILSVVRAELDYKFPLVSGDKFWVGSNLKRMSPSRFVFEQDIYRKPDDKIIIKAKIIGTALNAKRRIEIPIELEEAMKKLENQVENQ